MRLKGISKFIKITSFFQIVLFCFTGCSYLNKKVLQQIRNDPSVLDLETWTKDFGDNPSILISFIDGNSIAVTQISRKGKETKDKITRIASVNDYYVLFYDKNEKKSVSINTFAIWSTITGVQIKSIVDIVKNYQIICRHVEGWADLSDYKQDGDTFHETKNRVIAKKQYSDSVIFTVHEIILY